LELHKEICTELLARHGRPVLYYSNSMLRQRMEMLARVAAKQGVEFVHAVKSFPALEALRLGWEQISGFDVSNQNELRQVGNAKPPNGPSDTVFWGTDPQFSWHSFEKGLPLDGTYVLTLDHVQSLRKFEALHATLPEEWRSQVKYAIRINSEFVLNEVLRERMGDLLPSRFGAIPTVASLRPLLNTTAPFAGFHCHHGSENNNPAIYQRTAEHIAMLCTALGLDVSTLWLNLGGGLHGLTTNAEPGDRDAVRTHDGRLPFLEGDLAKLEGDVDEMVATARRVLPKSRLFFEPGRWSSLGTGFACGKVMQAQHDWFEMPLSHGVTRPMHTYTLDYSWFLAGIWDLPVAPPTANQSEQFPTYYFGPSCFENDRIGPIQASRRLEEGTILAFGGLSGYAAALRNDFNGIPRAVVEFLG